MKKVLLIFLVSSMLMITGCSKGVKLNSETGALFTSEKAVKVEELIGKIVEWNDNLSKVDFADVDSVNRATEGLTEIYTMESELNDSINSTIEKGQAQKRVLLPFSKIALEILGMGLDMETFGAMNNKQQKEYILENQVPRIEEAIRELLDNCKNKNAFVMNSEGWSEYLSILQEAYYFSGKPLNDTEGIKLPEF